jgi:hypothetical protein
MNRSSAIASILSGAVLTVLVHGAGHASQPPVQECAEPVALAEAPEDEGKDPGLCPHARAPRLPLAPQLEGALLEAESDTDVTHYFLELEIIPEYSGPTVTAVRVEGVNTIDLEPTVDGLTSFTLDLYGNLTVNAVTGDVSGFSRLGNTIEITLDRPYDIGEPIQVAVDYEGYPQSAAFGAFRWWLRNDGLLIATLSQPFFARYWWPCKDALDDKATMQMHVTVPSHLVALSNGLELGSKVLPGDRTRYLWQETYPMIPYLASLAIGGYERYELQYDYDDGGAPASMPVDCHVYPDHWDAGAGEPLAAQKAGCDELPGMLETLSAIFGEYPWIAEKYGVVETGGTGGLSASMEHQTLSSMWRLSNFSDIMAHELAHQWWGDEITCQTWYDIWLNEGFATYSEALYREHKTGGSISSYWSRMNTRRPSSPNAQVYRTSIDTTGAIFNLNAVYQKGAWVLHMLRHVIGEEGFLAALTDYRSAFQNGSATTEEFSNVVSSSFGQDLSWFTDQWVMNRGSPDYEWNYAAENIGGQDYLKLSIWQRQDLEGFGLFTMPIDIRVTTASGSSVHRLWNDDWNEYYVIPIDGPPIDVEFDADGGVSNRNWVLWDTLALVATPLEAPPVLLRAELPALAVPASETAIITLVFSEEIGDFDAADVTLSGSASGAHAPLWVSYDAGTRTATIAYAGLPADDYVLAIADDGIFANGKAIDGEVSVDDWWDDVSLPSGDGQPGGDALLAFSLDARPVPSAAAPLRVLAALLLLAVGRRTIASPDHS